MQCQKRNFTKPAVNPDKKKNVNPFRIDESDAAVAGPDCLITDSVHDEDEDIDIM